MVEPLSRQIETYESTARKMAKDLDLRSREARKVGKQRLEEFVTHVKKSRNEIESKLKKVVDTEHSRLNKRLDNLVKQMRSVAKMDEEVSAKASSGKSASKKKKSTKSKATKAKKKTAKKASKKKTTKKKSAAKASPSSAAKVAGNMGTSTGEK